MAKSVYDASFDDEACVKAFALLRYLRAEYSTQRPLESEVDEKRAG